MLLFNRRIRIPFFLFAGTFIVILFLLTMCDSSRSDEKLTGITHPSGEEFAGSETCAQCHQTIADSFSETPHFLTSSIGSPALIKGSLDSGENVLALTERLQVFMEQREGRVIQRATVDGQDVDAKPVDISIGSGRQGQTYLYWQGDSLFQLPASYHAASNSWSNSPGYPTDRIVFDRSITARCLECHTTYFKGGRSRGEVETFDRSKAILGVDCERCHGPAASHVNFHQKNSEETKGKFITNPQLLDKKLRIDNCALCHSGMRTNLMPSFSYTVGNNLDRFFVPVQGADSGATPDVHGNQVGLLKSSKCYKLSEMDCSTCHSVHVKETKKIALFSARCMSCHEEGSDRFCRQAKVAGLVLSENCIDCHMPSLPSRNVFLQSASSSVATPFFVRTHLISTYRKQVELFLEELGKKNSQLNQ